MSYYDLDPDPKLNWKETVGMFVGLVVLAGVFTALIEFAR